MILNQVKPEHVYFDFEDETQILDDVEKQNIVITGNRDFTNYGDADLLAVIKGDYYDGDLTLVENPDGTCYEDTIGYDYDIYEELKKLTNKEWEQTTIKGYSQGDWQDVYYVKDEIDQTRIKEIEDFYMGKVSEFRDEDNVCYFVPDDITWDGKDAICNYLGLDPNDTIIFNDEGDEIK